MHVRWAHLKNVVHDFLHASFAYFQLHLSFKYCFTNYLKVVGSMQHSAQ